MTSRRMQGSYAAHPRNLAVIAGVAMFSLGLSGCADNGVADVAAECVDRTSQLRVEDFKCPANYGDTPASGQYAWKYYPLDEGSAQYDDDGNYVGTSFVPIFIGDVGTRTSSGGSYARPRNFKPGRVMLAPPRSVSGPLNSKPGQPNLKGSTISRGGLGITSSTGGGYGAKGGSSGS